MSVANLFNVPGTQQEWASWSLSHVVHHREIIAAVRAQNSVNLSEYSVDPIPFFALDGWVWNHQRMHTDFVDILKLGGFDLTGLDVENEGQVAAWIRLHAQEHLNAARALNI